MQVSGLPILAYMSISAHPSMPNEVVMIMRCRANRSIVQAMSFSVGAFSFTANHESSGLRGVEDSSPWFKIGYSCISTLHAPSDTSPLLGLKAVLPRLACHQTKRPAGSFQRVVNLSDVSQSRQDDLPA